MNLNSTRTTTVQRYFLPLVALVLLAAIGVGYGITSLARERRVALVAARGAEVMPFNLDATMHQFEPTAAGGIQQVTAHDPSDTEQIRLIRTHLQHEATRFQRGDFSDPAAIHGATIPGLAELRAGAERIEVQYRDLPAGGQITYSTDDPALIQALHHWFDAQLSDHGKHAMPGLSH